MRKYNGISDTPEDDVEQIHQTSAEIEASLTQMKYKGQQANIHSKMKAV
jgi:hypothetical protein